MPSWLQQPVSRLETGCRVHGQLSAAGYLPRPPFGAPGPQALPRKPPSSLRHRRGFPAPDSPGIRSGRGVGGRNTSRLGDISEASGETVTTWNAWDVPAGQTAGLAQNRPNHTANTDGSASDMFQAALSTLDLGAGPTSTSSFDSIDDLDGPALSTNDSTPDDVSMEQQQTAASVGRAVYEVLRIDLAGKTRKVYVRRRDLLRAYGLQPRDLRRIDPSLSPTKTSPSVTIKDSVLLINMGGVRTIVSAEKCLLFEPKSGSSRKFLELVAPRLQANAGAKLMSQLRDRYPQATLSPASFEEVMGPPFELEMLEGSLMVATGRLDNELLGVTRRVSSMLQKLPRDINPVNLEELRRVKQILVELESKADSLRSMLEELMDDEDDLRDMNLSSRPAREEKRRQRERDRLKQEVEREYAEREERQRSSNERSMEASASRSAAAAAAGVAAGAATSLLPGSSPAAASLLDAASALQQQTYTTPSATSTSPASTTTTSGGGGRLSKSASTSSSSSSSSSSSQPYLRREGSGGLGDRSGQNGDSEYGEEYADAEERLEEMVEAEEEERELEEVEDLLEYYLQRAATTQSEAERLLAGARDLEESIGVSLSARRYEVNRLELTLSICSFAAAVGAMVAGIFGMNLRSTMEMSVVGFWGITAAIVLGCCFIFVGLYRYTKKRRIL